MKNILLFCNGLSGSGKTYFIENFLSGAFYNLKSFTTRPARDGEIYGDRYYFVDEEDYNTVPMTTRLWVNQAFWEPGKPKWLYGVPEFEIRNNLGKNLVYDVIQPRYTRQLIDWFKKNKLNRYYDCRIAYFLAPTNNYDIAKKRENMPDDARVRHANTCNPIDFLRANLGIDYLVKCSAEETIIPDKLRKMIARAHETRDNRFPCIVPVQNKFTHLAQKARTATQQK